MKNAVNTHEAKKHSFFAIACRRVAAGEEITIANRGRAGGAAGAGGGRKWPSGSLVFMRGNSTVPDDFDAPPAGRDS